MKKKMKKCDICDRPDLDIIVDGKTIHGPWAWMCVDCYREVGVGLGLGRGQLFIQYKDGELIKIAG